MRSASVVLCDVTVIYAFSLCVAYVICLTALKHLFQGDIGLSGPPGLAGPTVSEISLSLPFSPLIYSSLINHLCCLSPLRATSR